jgi:signal transduction histidine kinase
LREEQSPIQPEGGISPAEVPLPLPSVPLSPEGWSGETPDTISSAIHISVEKASRQPKSSQLRALTTIAASLPGAETIGLLRYERGTDGQTANFIPVQAIRMEQNHWNSLQQLDPQLLENLAAMVAPDGRTLQREGVVHLEGTLVVLCRSDEEQLLGALVAMPDTFRNGAVLPPAAPPVDLVTTLALLALELETSALEVLRMARIASEESAARETFISFGVHELRSPLTSIKGFAQLLIRQSRKTELPQAMVRSIQSIDQQSLRMSEMLGEMLDASRILHGHLEMVPVPMDLADLVNKVVERRRTLFPDHDFTVLGTELAVPGQWDSGRVEQILRDLLDNAARHSPVGTSIMVEVASSPHTATVSVRDQGTGIAQADQRYLFGYLYHTQESERRNLSGLGLGLFVSRYLARCLGGDLWLDSSNVAFPSGSEFRFALPR